ncbi:MAG: peptidoglycan DD-metalloendopeptidase family protein [Bacterioplanes sp.]|nr:peptidoglycan DD-metalloendopeptidase family protein [Bacterioplanes sp.]
MKVIGIVVLVTIVTSITGCLSSREFISVEEKFSEQRLASGIHRVERGDTLYSIAWRYGVDFQQLASANSISSPYTIYPGQEIDVSNTRRPPARVASNRVEKPSTVTASPVIAATQPKPVPVVAPVTVTTQAADDWIWPVNGRLIGRFSTRSPINKGIDIAAPLGESVMAAASGTVVYAGQGLRGYGNLVIVKHNDTYLSAYAHCSRILVSEQDDVKAGQKIAEIGSTGTDRVMLHFEIRQNGQPVDPLKYLPEPSG